MPTLERGASSRQTILEVTNLSASYGEVRALSGVSLHVDTGEVVALLGANGAGKTTTMRCLMGLLRPDEGAVVLRGERIDRLAPQAIVRKKMALVPEGRRIFPELTVQENLELGAYIRAGEDSSDDFERVYDLFPVLKERRQQLGGSLSGGEQQMLAIGRALMSRPELLLLDEPSMGLAPRIIEQIFELIARLNRQGMAIFLVEQNTGMALEVAHRGYVLETGSIVLEGTARELEGNEMVRQAYLGG